jgi:hypothetical protein
MVNFMDPSTSRLLKWQALCNCKCDPTVIELFFSLNSTNQQNLLIQCESNEFWLNKTPMDWKIKSTRSYWSLIKQCDSKFYGDSVFIEWVIDEQLILSDAEHYHTLT